MGMWEKLMAGHTGQDTHTGEDTQVKTHTGENTQGQCIPLRDLELVSSYEG